MFDGKCIIKMFVEFKCFQSGKKDKEWPQILTIFLVCLSSISSGMFFAWPSPFIVKLTQDKVNYDISEDEATFLAYIHAFTMVIFSVAGSTLNDLLGRKKCLLLLAIPQAVFWIITAFVSNIYLFYLARVVSGFSDVLHFSTVPIYIAEIAIPSVRGSWGNILAYHIIGEFLINLIGLNFSVQQTSYICVSLPVIFAILMIFLPESPYYSIMKNRYDEARNSLRFFRGKDDVEDEFLEIKAAVERQMSEKGTWKELVSVESNRKALLAALFLRISQQFAGLGAFTSYTHFIFEKSGSSIDSSTSTLISSATLGILSFAYGYVGERMGRKKSYTTSMATCSVVLLGDGLYFYFDQYTGINLTSVQWLPLAGMILYFIFSGVFGVLSIPTLMSGELFPNNVKTKAFGIQLILQGGLILVGSVVFYEMNSTFGLAGPFLLFGVCSVISSVASIYIVPETKGKTLEEIQKELRGSRKENNV